MLDSQEIDMQLDETKNLLDEIESGALDQRVEDAKSAAFKINEQQPALPNQPEQAGFNGNADSIRHVDGGDVDALVDTANIRVRQPKQRPLPLTPLDRRVMAEQYGQAAEAQRILGGNTNDEVAAGTQAILDVMEDRSSARAYWLQTQRPMTPARDQQDQIRAQMKARQESVEKNLAVTPLDMLGASIKENTITSAVVDAIINQSWNDKDDPAFDYNVVREQVEAGRNEEERVWLRGSGSQAELDDNLRQLKERDENYRIMGAHGAAGAVAAGLTGGLLDPSGWVLGAGVGKVAQLANVGVRSLEAAPFALRATQMAAEGAVSNVLFTAALDASGRYVSADDYAYAAGFGAVFGQLGHLARRNIPGDRTADANIDQGQRVMDEAVAAMHEDLQTVQTRVGPDATPEQMMTGLDDLARERFNRIQNIVHAPADEADRILPTGDGIEKGVDGRMVAGEEVNRYLHTPAEIDQRVATSGLATMEHPAEARLAAEIQLRADKWVMGNPVEPGRVSVLSRVPWLGSSGQVLATSNNPVLQMVAGTLLESTTGVNGRRRTAAIDKALLERQYLDYLHKAEAEYQIWAKRNGSNQVKDFFNPEARTRFNRAVALEIENRRLGVRSEAVDVNVARYADHLQSGYERMLGDQKARKTLGYLNLPENSVGYQPRRLSTGWVMQASDNQRRLLRDVYAKQLEESWGDKAFAENIANRVLDRAIDRANGGASVPANLHSPEGADLLEDIIKSMGGIDDDQAARLIGQLARGGAGHTKHRLDLDLTAEVRDPVTGDGFTMIDAFEQDPVTLFQQYARRASGEAALANWGIRGTPGLRLLRLAAERAPEAQRPTPDQLKAFDQIAAEFMGTPLPGTGNKYLNTLRLLTMSSRLGGMLFPQVAELANAVPLLGVTGALKMVPDMPGLIGGVVKGKSNPMLESLELIGGPVGMEHQIIMPYQELDDIRVYSRDSLNGFERAVRAGANALPYVNGFHYLHAAQVRGMSQQIISKGLKYVRDGGDNAALEGMGITSSVAKRLKADLDNVVKFDKDGNIAELDLSKTSDPAAVADFVQAVHRGARQIIQGTYIGETGKWAHHDLLRLLTQFRTFGITAMEKQWTRQRADGGSAQAFGTLVAGMSFALPIHLARVQLNAAGMADEKKEAYLENQLNPLALSRALLNYTTVSGLTGDILDSTAGIMGYSTTGGRSGTLGSPLDTVPGLGYIGSTINAVQEKDPRQLARALPFGNLPYLTPFLNGMLSPEEETK